MDVSFGNVDVHVSKLSFHGGSAVSNELSFSNKGYFDASIFAVDFFPRNFGECRVDF